MAMKKISLEQGTDEWLQWRNGGIGASEVSAAIGKNKYQSPKMLLNKKLGYKKDSFSDFSQTRMQRGKDLEPLVREMYQGLTGIKSEPVCVVNDKYPWLLASLDGLSECEKIVLEIKCASNKVHEMALEGQVVDYYYWQVLAQLIVTEADYAHYVSYSDDDWFGNHQRLAIVRVDRDKLQEYSLISKTKLWWENFLKQKELKERAEKFRAELKKKPEGPIIGDLVNEFKCPCGQTEYFCGEAIENEE